MHKINDFFILENSVDIISEDDHRQTDRAVCVVSISPHQNAGNIEAHIDGNADYWTYSTENKIWTHTEAETLTEREKEILLLTVRGHTEQEIADSLFISKETVKFHKQKTFGKLGVSHISAAIAVASHNKML